MTVMEAKLEGPKFPKNVLILNSQKILQICLKLIFNTSQSGFFFVMIH